LGAGGYSVREKKAFPAIIDCDPGVDDALALALAMASPEMDLRAVTTVHGNIPARMAYRNARRMVSFLHDNLKRPGLAPPVYAGAGKPIGRGRIDRTISYAIHGKDGLGDLFRRRESSVLETNDDSRSSDQVIAGLALEFGKALCVIAIGPLTNLALAIKRDRKALAGVGRIVVMGGAARMPGNVTPAAEFNVYCDPEAAELVMNCGAPITMIGLDVTRQALLPSTSLKGGGPFRRALRELVRPYAGFSKNRRGVDGVTLHDPLAVAAAIETGLVDTLRRKVSVECGGGPSRGMTVVDLRPEAGGSHKSATGVDVALGVDAKRFLRFFLKRLGSYHGWV
jgi:pyrimidine-specific ribonucleoside hydrolase